ncbi:hypothetical protein JOQ06_029214 [Pogonophryne albipinna]|uniref:HAT C-terminal dimerisation domain-containing protein n=1 Tax=Pogonophryne albipinna TaxID=1090488 RepID=A0AAD6AID2_9TELE|nr:hypothetical protein JOQ06_008154 [Pogonophryne albipinna]KAJ4939778.1 hypothetical protein JOQ06_029214 [Pogonophryne albipinna]
MLESISCQYEDVCALLLERGEEGRLNDLSEDTLNAMVMFLQRFKEATKALEASKTPTLHLTAVWLDRLKRHLQPSSTDNQTFSSLKAKCHVFAPKAEKSEAACGGTFNGNSAQRSAASCERHKREACIAHTTCCHSSSAASERDFSTAGFVVSERRSQLKPGTVDDIFLHSNLKKH